MGNELLVAAAASLTDALTEVGRAFDRANRATTRFTFAASGVLEQQIRAGAPIDVFASAGAKEMDELAAAGRIEKATRTVFATNRLVLIVPAAARTSVRVWDDLRGAVVRRIAVSNPDAVPSGRYARETLTKRGLWSTLQTKLVLGENVRQTLAYVSGGDADAGLVFATDARIEAKRVRVVATAVPGRDHAPIAYPAAVVAGAPNAPLARTFVAFLKARDAQAILRRYGFGS
jgi:molybdate transport system substrate-binding protein